MQLERLCKISLERDEMARKLEEVGDQGKALLDARAQVCVFVSVFVFVFVKRMRETPIVPVLHPRAHTCIMQRHAKRNLLSLLQ